MAAAPPARFGAAPGTPGAARRHVRTLIAGVLPQDVVDEVVLAVSELVTNAVEHAGTSLEVHTVLGDGVVRVEVSDGSGELPRCADPGPRAVGGRGLFLVSQIADSWGVDARPDGKTVWFERLVPDGGSLPSWPPTPT